jgi:hypothetical protein
MRHHFEFGTDWYRRGPVAALIVAYYVLLRAILRTQPELRRCWTRSRHCGIFFLTHPRNAGRRDLGCPFGCRETHRCGRPVALATDDRGACARRGGFASFETVAPPRSAWLRVGPLVSWGSDTTCGLIQDARSFLAEYGSDEIKAYLKANPPQTMPSSPLPLRVLPVNNRVH